MNSKDDIIINSFKSLPLYKICHVPIIAVYKNPKDYTGKYVARLWDINKKPTRYVMVEDCIDSIRTEIPLTMYCLPPSSVDDPVIVETYL